ncbi:benzoate-CoA ligase family protein [soil metagenome]
MAEHYNAAADLLERNLRAGRGAKAAFVDRYGALTYDGLAIAVRRFAGALVAVGFAPGDRLILCLLDDRSFPIAFLGAIWAGVIPVPVNTMLAAHEYLYLVDDSEALAVIVSPELLTVWTSIAAVRPGLLIYSGEEEGPGSLFSNFERVQGSPFPAETRTDDVAFWLYSSGSTGHPKGAMHRHESLRLTADFYARPVAGYRESDVVLSVAKLFFAYGLGNALTFPMSCGATAILSHERPTPQLVSELIDAHSVTIFCGVPSFFVRWLDAPTVLSRMPHASLRLGISAGEPLPTPVLEALNDRLCVDVIDGLGSTEMLHIFVSQRPGSVRAGTTGYAVDGYEIRVVDDHDVPLPPNRPGHLQVRGHTAAAGYWKQKAKTEKTFKRDGWVNTGDQARLDAGGWCHFIGRADDMLKVNGRFVSPLEVEAVLLTHSALIEAAIVAGKGSYGLSVPQAFLVLRADIEPTLALADDIKRHALSQLPRFKCPELIFFVESLPKTSTGKLQRYRLRDER